MKIRTIVYISMAVVCSIIISSYSGGPGINGGWDCTGAETGLQNPTGCSGGCHSSSANLGISVSIELDSAGVPTTHYTPGANYTVKFTGTNNTGNTLPKYGFQMNCIKGSVAVTTPTPIGTWVTPYPAQTHLANAQAGNFVATLVEQSSTISATTGSGGNGTTYSKTFNWKAPAAGTGTVSIWTVVNAVNGNGTNDGNDLWNTNHIVVNEWSGSTGIESVSANQFTFSVYPNPVQTTMNLVYTLNETGKLNIQLFDMHGSKVADLLDETQTSGTRNMNIALPENLREGIYILKASVNDAQCLKKIIVSK